MSEIEINNKLNLIKETGLFQDVDIPLVYKIYQGRSDVYANEWQYLEHSALELPLWFDRSLEAGSEEYSAQQHRLWRLITGLDRDYSVVVDEQTHGMNYDNIRFPGDYSRRDPGAVINRAHHTFASAMIMQNSNIQPGQWALEYGAGFAQTALTLARLGVNVDTVDVSSDFCAAVKQQADFFNVPLTPYQDYFGSNPRGDKKYNLILFYECFHHWLDVESNLYRLKDILAPDGRIILAGEPVVVHKNNYIPYDWGLRLHSECICVIRERKWFELGFTEEYLFSLFDKNGFNGAKMICHHAEHGNGYIFTHK